MQGGELRLSQIVTVDDLKEPSLSQMHKLGNSLRRSASRYDPSLPRSSQYYECKLPDVGFGKKDLSLILRYLFYKEEMQAADRNLLRRILLSAFDEEVICAGGKNFIHFLRLLEGRSKMEIPESPFLYFLIKGKGRVKSGNYTYEIISGCIFGEVELILGSKIQSITFESSYLLLTLPKKQFDFFFLEYYQSKYSERLHYLDSIEQIYLNTLPELPKYILLKQIRFRKCIQGEKIVISGAKVENIYFVNIKEKYQQLKSKLPCLGLMQVLKGLPTHQETFLCIHKKIIVPFVKVTEFKAYVLDVLQKQLHDNFQQSDLTKSFLSLNPPETLRQRPKLISFMRGKKVRISLTKSRLKTEPSEHFDANFKFLKEIPKQIQNFRYKHLTEKKMRKSIQRECNSSFLSSKRVQRECNRSLISSKKYDA